MSGTATTRMRWLRLVVGWAGTVLLGVFAAFTIATATGTLKVTPVLSGSMRPDFNPGDAMLTERVASTSLHVGDIVNIKVPQQDGGGQRVHRIVAIRHKGTAIAVQTKGDANAIADSSWIVLKGDQYRTVARLPYVGWIANFHAANGALILLIAIAAVGAFSLTQRFRLRRSRIVAADTI